jgi:uncharacterized protein YbbC (DUF1343 family)
MALAGIDVVLRDRRLGSDRIALATNPSAVTKSGVPSWKALLDSGCRIGAFFGPEHGFRGDAQDGVEIGDGEFLGIPSYSLFGSRLEPEPRMLDGIDIVVYDIQDVGCRYYTYLYTLANIMRVCEKTGTKVLVLDRPDPIGGVEVEGAPMGDEYACFVGAYRLPHRFGMTVGEFARYLKGEFFPHVSLEVVRVEGWKRAEHFDSTGLPWVMPSPNIPSLSCALVYPGTCLFEGTNLSEGRGTTRPFETFGAPWIDGPDFREKLAAMHIPGVVFTAAAFTPSFSKHAQKFCGGVTMCIDDSAAFKPLYAGIAVLKASRDLYPEQFEWKPTWENPEELYVDRLAGGPALRTWIDTGATLPEIYRGMTKGETEFAKLREAYLLYA